MLNPEDIKQVFFHCNFKDPAGFYANDVDILEFGQKIAAFALAQKKPMTEDEVLDFMLGINLTENGDALLDRVKTLVRAVEKFHRIT
jgi:hypothetical protein